MQCWAPKFQAENCCWREFISQLSPSFLSLPLSLPGTSQPAQRLLPGFKPHLKLLHLNNTEQISSTASPPNEYFIRQPGAKAVGGGITLTAWTHGC